jgi:N-acyl-D-amino-acid deacylase
VIEKVEAAREQGLRITSDMYTYTAGATGLNAAMPPWVQEGGFNKWRDRLRDNDIRKRVLQEMKTPTDDWENLMLMAGSPEAAVGPVKQSGTSPQSSSRPPHYLPAPTPPR